MNQFRTSVLVPGLLLGLLAPSAVAQQSLAEQLPAETALYFDVPSIQAFADGFATSALGRIWSDPAMQEFLTPVLPMVDGGLMQARMALASQGLPEGLLDPASFGRLEVGMAFGPMRAGMQVNGPDMVIGARIEFLDSAVAQGLFGLASAALQSEGAEATADGVHLDDGTGTVDLRLQGSTMSLLARKGAFGTGSLATAPAFVAARQSVSRGQAFMHMDMGRLMEVARGALALGAPPQVQAMVPAVMEAVGLDSLATLSFSTGWKGGESFGEGVMTFGPNGPSGLIGAGLSGSHRADKSLAEYVPPDATQFAIGVSDLGGLWSFITSTADRLIAMAEEQGQVIDRHGPELAWLYGEDRPLYDKAFAAIGPETFSWAKAEVGIGGGGGRGGSYLRVRDVGAVRDMFGQVMPQLSALLAGVDVVGLEVKSATTRQKDAEGNWTTVKLGDYYQINFNIGALPLAEEAKGPLMMLSSMIPKPAFGVTDDGWLVFSMNGVTEVRNAMKSGVVKPEKNILSNSEAADFLARVPASANALAWSDPRPVLSGAILMAQNVLPMILARFGDQIPLDLEKMPQPDDIVKHLRTSESMAWFDGKVARFTSIGSFNAGEGILLGGLFAAGMATFGLMQAQAAPELIGVEALEEMAYVGEEGEAMDTASGGGAEAELIRLDTGITLYRVVNGSYPASLAKLLEPQADWEEGFLADRERGLIPDAWGNAFVYKALDGGYALYSCGQNGMDEGGAGDDVTVD